MEYLFDGGGSISYTLDHGGGNPFSNVARRLDVESDVCMPVFCDAGDEGAQCGGRSNEGNGGSCGFADDVKFQLC